MNESLGDALETERVEAVAADKGYFKTAEIAELQEINIEAAITNPLLKRTGNAKQALAASKARQIRIFVAIGRPVAHNDPRQR